MKRLHTWSQISGWPLGVALTKGDLRALCAHPWCDRAASFAAVADPEMRLWVIAKRLRCRGCGHLGAQFEIWGAGRRSQT